MHGFFLSSHNILTSTRDYAMVYEQYQIDYRPIVPSFVKVMESRWQFSSISRLLSRLFIFTHTYTHKHTFTHTHGPI